MGVYLLLDKLSTELCDIVQFISQRYWYRLDQTSNERNRPAVSSLRLDLLFGLYKRLK